MTGETVQQLRDRVFDDLHRSNRIVWAAMQPLLEEIADLRERVRVLELARDGLPDPGFTPTTTKVPP